jgi:hypothetical protein
MTAKVINLQEKLEQILKNIEIWKNNINFHEQEIITNNKKNVIHKQEIVINNQYIKDAESKITTVFDLFMVEEEEVKEVVKEEEVKEEEVKEEKVKEEIEEEVKKEEVKEEEEIEKEEIEEVTPAWRNINIHVLIPPNNSTQQIQQKMLKPLIKKTFNIPFWKENCKEFLNGIDNQINTNSKYAILNTFEENFGVVVYNKNMSDEKYNSDVKYDFYYSTIAPNQTEQARKAIESVWNKLEGKDNEVIIVLINDRKNKYYFYIIRVGFVNNSNKKFIEDKYYKDDCAEYINWRKKYK